MLSIGLMSGTSMDGIDAALINTDGKSSITEIASTSLHYTPEFRIALKAAEYAVRVNSGDLAKAKIYYPQALQDYLINELGISPESLDEKLETLITASLSFDEVVRQSTKLHADTITALLQKSKRDYSEITVIGYHGQTLFHNPSAHITIQIGDGKLLADLTGITVINDFRSRDIAAGGQGAPFAPLYHQALALRDNKVPVAIVNCGGIANITVISGASTTEVIGFDTGPGNGLIDQYVRQQTNGREQMDQDGKYGRQGKVQTTILDLLYRNAISLAGKNFFTIPPPRSLDIGDLKLIPELNSLTLPDACATLAAFTADTIVKSTEYFTAPHEWILAGGGWHNPVIYSELEKRLTNKFSQHLKIHTADQVGWNGQALEAQIFAYLAVRSLNNLPISLPGTTGVPLPLTGGQVHYPS